VSTRWSPGKRTIRPLSDSLTLWTPRRHSSRKLLRFFGGYLTIALAIFGAGGAVFCNQEMQSLIVPFWATGMVIVSGTACFLMALKSESYGALASHPDMWLNAGTIDGPDTVLPTMLAYITYHHRERIDTSIAMNEAKAWWIQCGIWAGIASPPLFAVLVMVC
jgi:hypothetical protein